jgi:hypothetical protein
MIKYHLIVYQNALLFLPGEQYCDEMFDTRKEAEARVAQIKQTINNYRDIILIEEIEVDE